MDMLNPSGQVYQHSLEDRTKTNGYRVKSCVKFFLSMKHIHVIMLTIRPYLDHIKVSSILYNYVHNIDIYLLLLLAYILWRNELMPQIR
jgi:hypothetical protein